MSTFFSHLFNSSYLKGNWQEQVGINRYNKQKTLSFVQYNRLKWCVSQNV